MCELSVSPPLEPPSPKPRPLIEQVLAIPQCDPPGDHYYGDYSPRYELFSGRPVRTRVCRLCEYIELSEYPVESPVVQTPKPLTARQREIIRAYFASGCRTKRTAQGLGISVTRVREVKAYAAAKVYLGELEADCAHAVVQARAAQILAPTLRP